MYKSSFEMPIPHTVALCASVHVYLVRQSYKWSGLCCEMSAKNYERPLIKADPESCWM